MGWLSGYSHRICFKIDHTKIDSDLTHFPVTLFLTEDNADAVFNGLGSNYKKIAVTSDDGTTQLYVEVEVWDLSSKQAVLHISRSSWTISSSFDTYFYLYYDASVADNTTYVGDPGDSVAANVWDSNFAGVWHLSQDPTGGVGCIKDSTGNNNDGTPQGSMTSSDLVDGQVGKALDFDGSDDYIDCGNDSSLNPTTEMTIETVINGSVETGSWEVFTVGRDNSSGRAYALGFRSNKIMLQINGAPTIKGQAGQITVSNNTDYFVVAKGNSTLGWKTWLNDSYDGGSAAWSTPNSVNSNTNIGRRSYAGAEGYFDGLIDEVRISSVARSDAWLKATYYSLFNNLIQEHLGNWRYRKEITISGSSGAGTGYQVLLKVGESSGSSNCDFHVEGHSQNFPSGTDESGDLRFVDNDESTLLNFWVEKVEGSTPDRVAYCWVKINDSLDSDVDIYCYYGNANVSNVSNGERTFIYFNDSGDTTGWTTAGVGTLSMSNGRLRVDSNDNKGFNCYRGNVQNASITATVFPQYNERYSLRLRQISGNTKYDFGGDIGMTWFIGKTISGSHTTLTQTSSGPTVNATHKLEFRISGTSLEGLVDDSVLLTVSDSSIADSGAFGLGCWYNSINEFDNIFVRKYISSEPSFSSASSGEIVNGWYFSGIVSESSSTISGALIYLYKQEDGSFIGFTESDANGNFYIQTTYGGAHFMICRHPTNSEYNALVYDNLYPGN